MGKGTVMGMSFVTASSLHVTTVSRLGGLSQHVPD